MGSIMAAKAHAILSASSSDRWLHCPPSARLCEPYEDKGSDYDAIADEIFRLRDQKEKSEADSHHRKEALNRIKDLQDFIVRQQTDITEFDETLVKKLIDKITVFRDHFTVEFKFGITIDIES